MKLLAALALAASLFIPAGPAKAAFNACSSFGIGGMAGDEAVGAIVCNKVGGITPPPLGDAPVNNSVPQIVGLDYGNDGTTTNLSGDTTTVTVNVGGWDNTPLAYSYNWHFPALPGVPPTSLGTAASLTIPSVSAVAGQVLEVDVTASNLAGSAMKTSYWFGPFETALPTGPTTWEQQAPGTSGPTTFSLPPHNFLQNGHAVFPGCFIPPPVPPNTATTGSPAHVFYYSPTGQNESQQNAAGVPISSMGRIGHPFKDLTTFTTASFFVNANVMIAGTWYTIQNAGGFPQFTTVGAPNNNVGTSFLASGPVTVGGATGRVVTDLDAPFFNKAGFISPGDTIYIEPGINQPLNFANGAATPYSTSTGADGGTVIPTWIMSDPASGVTLLNQLSYTGAGFIFKNFNVERYRNGTGVSGSGNATSHAHDDFLENINFSAWLGHSGGTHANAHYPSSGGISDGTVVTASPTYAPSLENVLGLKATAAAHATVIATPSLAPINNYVWSPGLHANTGSPATTTPGTGIPSGSIVIALNGKTAGQFVNNGNIVNRAAPSSYVQYGNGASTLGAVFTSTASLTGLAQDNSKYYVVQASATSTPFMYTYNLLQTITFTSGTNVANGQQITVNGVLWTFVTGVPTGNQSQIASGTNISGTIANLVIALNASADPNISQTTYAQSGFVLQGLPDTAGANPPFTVINAAGATAGANAGAWTLLGSFLPLPWNVDKVFFVTNFDNHVSQYAIGSPGTWTDLGTPTFTIGPCDPVANAATGCPTGNYPGLSPAGNVPGCDPFSTLAVTLTPQGGCAATPGYAGAPLPFTGTTRALSNEGISFTDDMVITPPGYWTDVDFDGDASAGMSLQGALDITHSQNPLQPNLYVGADCLSIKDSSSRYTSIGYNLGKTNDTVLFNNNVKYISSDAFEIYSDNRSWEVHNLYSEPSASWAHQDFMQFGSSTGWVNVATFDNAALDNEGYSMTDPTNYFPRPLQGINNTEGVYYNAYLGNNMVVASINGSLFAGLYNTMIHNINMQGHTGVGNQPKSDVGLGGSPPLTGPVHGLAANNIANGVSQVGVGTVTGLCTTQSQFGGNLSIGFSGGPPGGNSQSYCPLVGTVLGPTNANIGIFQGLFTWSPSYWWNNSGNTNPLFVNWSPITQPPPPTSTVPGVPWSIPAGIDLQMVPCVANSMQVTPPCNGAGSGVTNMRPNPAFVGTPAATIANVTANNRSIATVGNLPQTGAVGDQYIVGVASGCQGGGICGGNNGAFNGLTYGGGVWTRTLASGTTSTTLNGYGASQPTFEIDSATSDFCPGGTGCQGGSASVVIFGTLQTSISSWTASAIKGQIVGNVAPNAAVTVVHNNAGTIVPITTTILTIGTDPSVPFIPGISNNGVAFSNCGLSSTVKCEPFVDHDGFAFDPATPSIGLYQ